MFTEEINKIRKAEEAADAMRRNAKTDARQMIEAAKSEAKKTTERAQAQAKEHAAAYLKEGEKQAGKLPNLW